MAAAAGSRVLVLGDDVRMLLPITRSLGRKGIEVHLAWVTPGSPARRSRFVHRIHELPSPAEGGDGWIEPLQKLLGDVSFDLVLPATEPVVLAVQSHRDQLEHLARFYLLDDELFRIAFDKSEMQQLAEQAGLPLPEVCVVRCVDDVDGFFARHSGPAVVKPGQSVADAGGPKAFVQILQDRSATRRAVSQLLECGQQSVVLQSYFHGCGVGVEFLAENGQLLTVFQHRRLHETSGHGSTCRTAEAVSPDLRAAAARIVAALGYTGVGMCEFRRNAVTGEWIFIELNARFWGSLPLACAAGADFPWYLYRLLVDGVRETPGPFRTDVRCRSLTADLRWMSRAWRRQGLQADGDREQSHGWRLNDVPRRQVAGAALRLLFLRDHIDSLAVDDPAPFLQEAAQVLLRPVRRLTKRLTGSKQLTGQRSPRVTVTAVPQTVQHSLTSKS